MRDLTWAGPRTLSLGEADGLSKGYVFPPGEAVEVTERDADAILAGERAEGFLEGGATLAETPEPERAPSEAELAGGEEG